MEYFDMGEAAQVGACMPHDSAFTASPASGDVCQHSIAFQSLYIGFTVQICVVALIIVLISHTPAFWLSCMSNARCPLD